jgi:hypothetical protein
LLERSLNLFARTKKEIPIHSKFQESLWSVENVVPEYEYVNLKRTVEDIPSGKIKMGNGDAQAIMGRGCDRFIQKPFNLQGLSQTYSINPEQSFPINTCTYVIAIIPFGCATISPIIAASFTPSR